MHQVGDVRAPKAPQELAAVGLEEGVLTDLGAGLAYTVAQFTTDWFRERLHVSLALAGD